MDINKNSYLTNYQLVLLIIGFLYGSTTITSVGAGAKQDEWIAFIIAWLLGFIVIYGYSLIAKLNPQKNLMEILQDHFGKFIGTLIAVLYIWYFTHLSSLVFRNYGEYLTTATFTETPMPFIILAIAVVVVYATRKGINNAGRTNEILMPVLTISIIAVTGVVINLFDFKNFLPVMSEGIIPILDSSFRILMFPFGETVVFLMIFPFLKNQKDVSKTTVAGIFVAGLFILTIIIRNIAILGPTLSSRLTYPTHTLTTLTENFSLEPVFDLAILTGGGAKLGVLIFAICIAISQLFNIKDFRPFVIPVVAFSVSLSIWLYPNSMEMFEWSRDVWPYYSIPFQLIIPTLLLIISFIKRKNKKATEE